METQNKKNLNIQYLHRDHMCRSKNGYFPNPNIRRRNLSQKEV